MTQPLTRDLKLIVNALEITEAELGFQANRLSERNGSTENEDEHLKDLEEGYAKASRYVGILLRYHRGRIGLPRRERVEGGSIDARGTSGAHINE